MTKKVNVMITAFRDGFQSAYGARVATEDFMPAVEATRDAGITHFEAGGGARFQSLFFYCQESAFDMMDRFREVAGPNANLQTLARGINVVALDSQPKDIIDLHARMFKKHGMTTIRNFDALNDVNNLIYSGERITAAGLNHEVVVTMMELPPGCTGAHDVAFYENVLRQILDANIPFTSVCFKDASGTSCPQKVFETIKMGRKMLPEGTKITFHTHDTAGIGVISCKAAIEAGVDSIDLSMAPCSGGTCQVDVATMWHALKGTDYQLNLDIDKIMVAEEVFKDCMKDYFMPPEAKAVEPLIPWSPMPGGALTANTQMMRDNDIMDKYPEVIKAMGKVVRLGGFGTSVTPVSQFYFQQAFNNVMFGEWKKIAPGYGKMVLGYFGKTPVTPDAEVIKICAEKLGLEPTTRSPLEMNEEDPNKGLHIAEKLLDEANLEKTEENIFIAAACEAKGIAFLKGEAPNGIRKNTVQQKSSSDNNDNYTVTVDGKSFAVELKDNTAIVNGTAYPISIVDGIQQKASSSDANTTAIKSGSPGTVFKIVANVGDSVSEGDTILVLEAMKMQMEVKSPTAGTVASIDVTAGDKVANGATLATLS